MSQSVLTAERRDSKGKGPARRLRQTGLIPAVVYGLDTKPTALAVNPKLLMAAIDTPHKFNTLLNLKVEGGDKFVLFKDYQVDPVNRQLLHADFLEVKLDQPVKVEVPVKITGLSIGVTEGGILSIPAHEIVVEALPEKIPLTIDVDVTPLKVGQSIHISELTAPEGCKFKFATNYVVAFVAIPEKEEVVTPVAAVVGAEGAAAAPAAGAAAG
ncbi:MAG: 50S ribosomal protein L25/general stress protein Ctc, partial [Anaeromyxobacteraceae bacterium]